MAHAESRPVLVELEAVHRAIFFAQQTGGWIHIVHMSAPEAVRLVKQAKQDGIRVTCETCPQYLALDLDDLKRLGPLAVCMPAVRSRERVEQLWELVAEGTVDCITSDHCGYTLASKQAAWGDVFASPGGMSGIQTLLPLFITEARARGLGWEQIAELTAGGPARLWQLTPKKGAIRLGADADLVLLDPDHQWTLSAGELLHAHPWSPWEGHAMRGRIRRTVLRGKTIYDDAAEERVLIQPGYGQFVQAQS
jgi:allantoinase